MKPKPMVSGWKDPSEQDICSSVPIQAGTIRYEKSHVPKTKDLFSHNTLGM